jgi:hypothetical protein
MATVRDRRLHLVITGVDPYPDSSNQAVVRSPAGVEMVGNVPLMTLQEEWDDKNNAVYSQILLCISPELQTAIDTTIISSEVWNILLRKFESQDPSKINIVRTRYESYHMQEGQTVSSYLTIMREYRNQLATMGEIITDSTHATTILRNIPDSWRSIAQTIRMITRNPDDIEERFEAHEADLNAIEFHPHTSTSTSFSAQPKTISRPNQPTYTQQNSQQQSQSNTSIQRPAVKCNNCGRLGHPYAKCYAPGGTLAGKKPWGREYRGFNKDVPKRFEEASVRAT